MEDIQQPVASNQNAPCAQHEPPSTFDVRKSLSWIKHFFDYLGASREEPPPGVPFLASSWWPGLWWGLLAGLILLFCGQTSKFIYIDF
jgi:hypothetical protein